MSKIDASVITTWRIARRVTLAAIVVAGTMSTAAAVSQRMAQHPCQATAAQTTNYYTYSGIGVELTQDGNDFVVSRVFPGTPADGMLYPGAVLLSVDGESPENIADWTRHIRGSAGTYVELEVAYPCSGHDKVLIERSVVQLAY